MGNRYSDDFVKKNQHRIGRIITDLFKHPESSMEFQEKKLHIRQWLRCFKKDPPKHCPLALRILESIDYYSFDDIRKMVKYI